MKIIYKTFLVMILTSCVMLINSVVYAIEKPRIALIIGNSAYKDSPLVNPVNDASDMANLLKQYGFSVILGTNVTKREMKEMVRDFSTKISKGAIGLFYFSGHGIQIDGKNYLIPVGVDIKAGADIEFESLDLRYVFKHMEDANNGLNIIILDACRNNPFKGNEFKSLDSGLARVDSPIGSVIAYATAPGRVALGEKGQRNSIYTRYLLEAFYNYPSLGINDLFIYVANKVVKQTNRKQIPWQSVSLTQQFCFSECGNKIEENTTTNKANKDADYMPTSIDSAVFFGKLNVYTDVENPTIKVLNIKPKFYQGMELEEGDYHIEVSAQGYETKRDWINLSNGEQKKLVVLLNWSKIYESEISAHVDDRFRDLLSRIERDLSSITTFPSGKTISDFHVSERALREDRKNIGLILQSESMNDGERQYWLNLLEIMNNEQKNKLDQILTKERKKLWSIDYKYANIGNLNIKYADAMVRLVPTSSYAYQIRAGFFEKQGYLEKSIGDLNKAMELDPYNAGAYNSKAWLLATSNSQQIRDGKSAIKIASKAIQINKKPAYLDTLAAAYAEAGMFEESVRIQKNTIRMLKNKGEEDEILSGGYQERLESFKKNKPWRE